MEVTGNDPGAVAGGLAQTKLITPWHSSFSVAEFLGTSLPGRFLAPFTKPVAQENQVSGILLAMRDHLHAP